MTRRKVTLARRRALGEEPPKQIAPTTAGGGRGSLKVQIKRAGIASKHTRRGRRVLFHTTMTHPSALRRRRRAANRVGRASRRANR